MAREYGIQHIRWACRVQKSNLSTPDFMAKIAAKQNAFYLTKDEFVDKVESARRFLFEELPIIASSRGNSYLFEVSRFLSLFQGYDIENDLPMVMNIKGGVQ
jgi:hypothetical protein